MAQQQSQNVMRRYVEESKANVVLGLPVVFGKQESSASSIEVQLREGDGGSVKAWNKRSVIIDRTEIRGRTCKLIKAY
jgi:hypothetical protein